MKHRLLISLVLFCLLSCRKQNVTIPNVQNSYLENVKSFLKDSLPVADFQNLDFSKIFVVKIPHEQFSLLRIPFKGKPITNDFVLVKADSPGNCVHGRIISINGAVDSTSNLRSFNGNIVLSSLSRKSVLASAINKGFIQAFHSRATNLRRTTTEYELPEIVIISYLSHTDWNGVLFNLLAMMDDGNMSFDNIWLDYYEESNPLQGGGGFIGFIPDDPIKIDFENHDTKDPIPVSDYIKCFTQLADNGAICSIEILTDIPVDNDPMKSFDWATGSPGHTFLQIQKSNGSQTVSQNIGFYPEQGWKNTLTTAPQNGKFVDNEGHEFNASLKMNITPAQLQAALTEFQYLANFVQYDIDDYNCTDFALEVFNSIRSNHLEIPRYDIPGGSAYGGTSTPQGLYQQLKSMKSSGGPEAGNITIPGLKGYAGSSHGPCN